MNLSWQRSCRASLTPKLRRWLLDQGSMTARMLATGSKLRIQVCQHRFQQPTLLEANILKLPTTRLASIREVVMLCDEVPWLYARTVIPLEVLHGTARRLHYLGSTPLGRILFQELHLRRTEFEVAQMSDPNFLAKWSTDKKPQPLWARRSQFNGLRAPILLCEVFLPAMQEFILGSNE